MGKSSLFGEQVTRLVFALAGKKYQGSLGAASRQIAETIGYSEVTLRRMREGSMLPKNMDTLRALVHIGQRDAGLDRAWAFRLLQTAGYPARDILLDEIYGKGSDVSIAVDPNRFLGAAPFLGLRLAGGLAGLLLALAVWTYAFPYFPAAHEPGLGMELLWGLATGLGLAAGLAAADFLLSRRNGEAFRRSWPGYAWLGAGGLVGALGWGLASILFQHPDPAKLIQSNWLETFIYGAVYTAGFSTAAAWVMQKTAGRSMRRNQFLHLAGAVFLGGAAAAAGFWLANSHPAFSNQRDVDLFVSLAFRLGLAGALGFIFPPLSAPEFSQQPRLAWLPWGIDEE